MRGARKELRRRGLMVLGMTVVGASKTAMRRPSVDHQRLPGESRQGHKIPSAQWSQLILELSTLLSGGIPQLAAMKTLASEQSPRIRSTLIRVQEQIAGGMPLSEAIRHEGVVDDNLSIQLIRVGKETGHLDQTHFQLAAFQQCWLLLKD